MIRIIDDNGEEVYDIKERLRRLENEYRALWEEYDRVRDVIRDIERLAYNPFSLEDPPEERLEQVEDAVSRYLRRSPDAESFFDVDDE